MYKLPVIKWINNGDVMYNMVTIVNNCIAYWKVAKRVDLESFHHKKKNFGNYVWWWVLTTFCGDHFSVYTNIKSLYCIPGN